MADGDLAVDEAARVRLAVLVWRPKLRQDPQTQMLSHRREISVVVQQFMTAVDTKCADNHIHGLTNRNPLSA